MKKRTDRKKDENLKGIEYVNVVLIICACILSYVNAPFWFYCHSHYETKGVVVEIVGDKFKDITYEYANHEELLEKRTRVSVKTTLDVGDEIEISYNENYPRYVYISGLEEDLNLFRTLLGPLLCIFLAVVFQLGRYGIIKLN